MRRFATLPAAAMIAASPALAQAPSGAAGGEMRSSPPKYAAQELVLFSRCVASRRYERARALVLYPFGSAAQNAAAREVVLGNEDPCLKAAFGEARMAVRPDVLTGGIAQALVLKDYPNLPALIQGRVVDIEAERAQAAGLTAAERFGRCLVWRDPAAAQALLASMPGTREERASIASLKEDMGMCLAEGSTLQINTLFLRNITGVAAYRLAQQLSPRSPGGGGLAHADRQKRLACA